VAIYHFSAKVISRANGSSAVASAAYRSGSEFYDERLGRSHNFSNKSGVVHSQILAPDGAPERWRDRATLWNEVEGLEKRKDAQLAREVEFAIPRELDQAQGIALARDFVEREFVSRGMVADLNVHWDIGPDGRAKPHAHVMLSMRKVESDEHGEAGFGAKAREWNSREMLSHWREAWAEHVNVRLAELDIDARVDHRTLEAQQIDLEPQNKIGPAGARREERRAKHDPEEAERAAEHRRIARSNGERIIEDPNVALDAITQQQSTFTDHDLARFAHRHSDDAEQYAQVLSAMKTSPELVSLGVDGRGRERFSTREMIEVEQRLERSADKLAGRKGHAVSPADRGEALAAGVRRGLHLGGEQRDALDHIMGGRDLSMVVGYAGTGKSAMLGVAREAWETAGYHVRGAALSGIAAESLEAGSGIGSRTIASLEHGWAQGRGELTSRDVLVIDEAGMIGSRQLERVLSAAEAAGAKVVLVGDPEQLQAIEAGAAFRALAERHGAMEITEIRRQRDDWQRSATRELATERTAQALERYASADMVHGHETRRSAREALVQGWDAARQAEPEASQVILAHTRADVAELNKLARGRMRAGGELGPDQALATERGERMFAAGDRLVFLKSERSLGVKNGTLGRVEAIEGSTLIVRIDAPGPTGHRRQVRFDLKDYAAIDHGYASTIHKSQGVTVERAHVLATPSLDRHGAYVALSRHRGSVALHYGADDFSGREALSRTLSRERAKDSTLDYTREFAGRREIRAPAALVPEAERDRPQQVQRARRPGRFDGFKPRAPTPRPAVRTERGPESPPAPSRLPGDAQQRERAIAERLQAHNDAQRMRDAQLPVLPDQKNAIDRSHAALAKLDADLAQDLASVLDRRPELRDPAAIAEAVSTRREWRTNPQLRADRFVQEWQGLQQERQRAGGRGDRRAGEALDKQLMGLVERAHHDSPMTARLSLDTAALGLPASRGVQPSELIKQLEISISQGRNLGRGPSMGR
jgi:Ti-type conjugative transfer relaxase TraA